MNNSAAPSSHVAGSAAVSLDLARGETAAATNKGGHKRRITHAEREEILQVYLNKPEEGCRLAMSKGLSQIYAYKLAHERGLIPRGFYK